MGQDRKVNKVLVEKPKGKRPLGRPRNRWDVVRMDLRKMGWAGVTIGSGEGPVIGCCECCVMNFQVLVPGS
jgi:hypothetical protein